MLDLGLHAAHAYEHCLLLAPLPTKALTQAGIWGLNDALLQLRESGRIEQPRAWRFFLSGLGSGVVWACYYPAAEHLLAPLPGSTLEHALMGTLLEQVRFSSQTQYTILDSRVPSLAQCTPAPAHACETCDVLLASATGAILTIQHTHTLLLSLTFALRPQSTLGILPHMSRPMLPICHTPFFPRCDRMHLVALARSSRGRPSSRPQRSVRSCSVETGARGGQA